MSETINFITPNQHPLGSENKKKWHVCQCVCMEFYSLIHLVKDLFFIWSPKIQIQSKKSRLQQQSFCLQVGNRDYLQNTPDQPVSQWLFGLQVCLDYIEIPKFSSCMDFCVFIYYRESRELDTINKSPTIFTEGKKLQFNTHSSLSVSDDSWTLTDTQWMTNSSKTHARHKSE